MTFEIRPAHREDADGITDAQVAAWRAGYAHVFPESVLYADDFDSTRREFWNAWRFAPGHRLSVAVGPNDDGAERVLGFASYGPERERARGFTGRGEVWAFYVQPDLWGTGIASALMDHTETRLRAEGFDVAVLWVLDDNPRGRRFYEKHGWQASGIEADFDEYCEVRVPEVEYRKHLA
ncbi:MAG: GNAT family N-acetyltransferase [Ilumatobacter sp.]|uniref:GNAT family N-acetyltransferase n=1 Tax=Ilumatobacter sp. TaxID=1967498 RepID=UPI0026036BE9|nr:GNAT family N-acetyltransferase [Ilumatobacter sp.]MDJ0768550.1 GNAT family N-acetyltransferase [Ilumatobacter sp.]